MCIPGLHLSLGIFDRLWTLLENSCKEADFRLAVDSNSGSASTSSFHKLSVLKLESQTLADYSRLVSEMHTYATLSAVSDPAILNNLQIELCTTQKRMQDIYDIFYLFNTA